MNRRIEHQKVTARAVTLRGSLLAGAIWLVLTAGPLGAANQAADDTAALAVEGISAQSADDDPGVLYILPWQPPTLPRRPRARLDDSAPDLMMPMDPVALERHRVFRETLNPSMDSSLSLP